MKIIHPGNSQAILSPRCSIDAMKYSRNKKSVAGVFESHLEKIPLDANLEIGAVLHPINIDKDLTLFVSQDPHSWFIADTSFIKGLQYIKEQQHNSQRLDQETLATLYRKGLLRVNSNSLRSEELSGRYSVRSDNVALISVTDRCNLNCEHCVANANKNKLVGKELTFEELTNIFRYLAKESNPYGLDVEKKVFISGGEPLVRADLEEITLACAGEGLSTHICTNGLKITQDLLSKLRNKGIAFSV